MRNATVSLFLLCVWMLSVTYVQADALSYRIAPYEKACFIQPINLMSDTKATIYFYFAVQGQDKKMGVTVFDPNNQPLLDVKENYGDHVFDVKESGKYTFCLANGLSFSANVVDFDISVGINDQFSSRSNTGLAHKTIETFEESISRLKVDLRYLQAYQRYFKNRDQRNFSTVSNTESLIFWFSLIESILIVGVAVSQVYVLRRFFTTSRQVRV